MSDKTPDAVAQDLRYRKSAGEIRSYVWKVLMHSGVYEYESDYDELLDALIAAVRAECAAKYSFAVLSASTLGAARDAVERYAKAEAPEAL